MKNNYLKSIIVLGSICLVVALLLSGVNQITAPIIEKQASSAADEAYLTVLPNAESFETVNGDFPETVLEMKKDLGGTGFAFKLQTSSSYSQSPLQMILSIDSNGVITKLVITNYAETKGSAAEFMPIYDGKDGNLADTIIAGCTYTSTAIKGAVTDAFNVFYQYADIEKSDEQKLADLYEVVMPFGKDKTNTYNFTSVELTADTPNTITAIYSPKTEVGYLMTATFDNTNLVIGVNAYGRVYALYNLDGDDCIGDPRFAPVIKDAESAMAPIYIANNDKLLSLMEDNGIISSADKAKQVDFGAVSSHIVAVYEVADGYAYIAKAEGYGGNITVCYVINKNNEIVKYATLEQFEVAELEYLKSEFGTAIAQKPYADNIIGKTSEALAESDVLVAGSTFTSSATKICWNDIKSTNDVLQGGNK